MAGTALAPGGGSRAGRHPQLALGVVVVPPRPGRTNILAVGSRSTAKLFLKAPGAGEVLKRGWGSKIGGLGGSVPIMLLGVQWNVRKDRVSSVGRVIKIVK